MIIFANVPIYFKLILLYGRKRLIFKSVFFSFVVGFMKYGLGFDKSKFAPSEMNIVELMLVLSNVTE